MSLVALRLEGTNGNNKFPSLDEMLVTSAGYYERVACPPAISAGEAHRLNLVRW